MLRPDAVRQAHLNERLKQDAAVGVPIAALGCAVAFGSLALGQDWVGAPGRTSATTASLAAVSLYGFTVWLALRHRPATAENAHAWLLSLCIAMGLNHGFHLWVIGEPVQTVNAVLASLCCAYFFTSRPWFYTAFVVCVVGWIPGALLRGPFSEEWRQWSAVLLCGEILAVAVFEARRLGWVRLESMRVLAERRKAEVEEALVRAETATAERLAMESAMHEAQRRESLGILAGGIAHDFNNLLTVVRGNLELTELEPGVTPSLKEKISTISTAADRATQLTHQLLVYAGKARPKIADVELGARIEGAARLFQSVLDPNVKLTLHGQSEPVVVEADAALLDQVIVNFIQNATEACSPTGGQVDISWGPVAEDGRAVEPKRAFIEVADTGCGMDSAASSRMFDPFFTTKREGTGLGLAAVKGIADSHGATIELTTERGRGTTIRFVLPVRGELRARSPRRTQEAPKLGRPVLVVDDQPGVRLVARRLLEANGYSVMEADGGQSALGMGEELDQVGAAFVDLTMPGVSGYDVAVALRQRLPQLPIVIMSGFDRDDSLHQRPNLEEFPFLQKPFNHRQLIAALARATEPGSAAP